MSDRLDKAIVNRGLLTSREKAKREIEEGHVLVNGEVCKEVLYYADKTQISQVQESSAVSTF